MPCAIAIQPGVVGARRANWRVDISEGRKILGLARGAGKIEFEGERVDRGESRERLVEYAPMVLPGLVQGYCEYEGAFISQPRSAIRPTPPGHPPGRHGGAPDLDNGQFLAPGPRGAQGLETGFFDCMSVESF